MCTELIISERRDHMHITPYGLLLQAREGKTPNTARPGVPVSVIWLFA